jgi:hypothetical protein
MKKLICLVAAVGLVLFVTAQAMAVAPVAYWSFDNPDGQPIGGMDGTIPDEWGSIDLDVNEWNATTGNYFVGVNNTSAPGSGTGSIWALENYDAPAPAPYGSVSSYHLEGGISTTYGGSGTDPQLDPVAGITPDFWSWGDRLMPQPDRAAGGALDSDAAGGANGGRISYAFWLKINAATRWVDGARFGTDTSFVIGRRSDPGVDGGGASFGGQVGIRYDSIDGGSGLPLYKLQMRNYPGFFTTANTVLQGQWHHFVIEYDLTGANGVVNVWKDGLPSESSGPTLGNGRVAGNLILNNVAFNGASLKESGDFNLDDLAIYIGVDMTDQRVSEIYNNGVPEPSSIVLLVLGLLASGLYAWRRR